MKVKLLKHQHETLLSIAKYTLLLSGIGGGKSWTGVHWCIGKCKSNPKSLGFIGANTYSQLRDSTLQAVFSELTRLGISFNYNQSSGKLTFLGKTWLCKSMDNYDVIRGIEIGEFWLDEVGYTKEEAFLVLTGRLRDKFGSLTGLLTTSPNGFNFLYDYFHPNGAKNDIDYRLIKAKSKDNIFLPEGYLDGLYKQYNSKQVLQELEGEFVNISSGSIYWGFSREKNVKEFNLDLIDKDWRTYPLHVGMDFNVNPMTATVGVMLKNVLYIFDELFLKDSNTFQMADRIAAKYGMNGINIYADASGDSRKTSSAKTDHQILKERFGHGVVKHSRNPFRVDRYNCVNAAFEKELVVIHPNLKMVIKDFEQMAYKQGTNEPDLKDSDMGHISDAFGYKICNLFPIRPRLSGPALRTY